MDQIMGHKPPTMPESVVGSLALIQSTSESSEVQDEINEIGKTLFGDLDPTRQLQVLTRVVQQFLPSHHRLIVLK